MGIVEPLPTGRAPYDRPRPISGDDNLQAFNCGKQALDDFPKHKALKNEGKASRTYVVCSAGGEDAGRVVAYSSLAAGAVAHEEVPGWAKRNMPNPIPVFILGRLAVDSRHQAKGLGSALLREAMQRTLEASRQVGARALIVHAIDDEATNFYVGYGFQRFPIDSRTLFLPIETLVEAL